MSDIVPAAVGQLDAGLGMRLNVVQQCRAEDLDAGARDLCARLGVAPKVAPFFIDLPARIGRFASGDFALGCIDRSRAFGDRPPAILVPLPHALDQDQFANAAVIEAAGGAIRIEQRDFTPSAWPEKSRRCRMIPRDFRRWRRGPKAAARPMPRKACRLVIKVAGI
jgi:UDP-N-acetylglucosamine--N-acetylmuramyl-(pentapeptide) pyrophosphoryl-undecaprenol N-acetylglucosamine transferase